ncbi:copper homeostasis protein CutC [Bacillus sp. FJAT-27225]|uniref:copper homeostasis protein CutC n=1 Tax=Bacillus sp. FJAT-27225 TaxID=1743144 RepID=UPI00080C2B48|nr:copper homeostasis protein CutC [Bacillus sp. FJAT-27225]OCA83138.1 copper homeostasis protein CutC [Bacillus sp. FJAT-27225]
MKRIAEICCGSLEDAINAQNAGADRIELTNAMYLSGLTPSIGTIKQVVNNCTIPIVAMVRPRPGGFFYNDYEFRTMLADTEAIMDFNVEGIAFGCLDENCHIDIDKSKEIIDMIHQKNKDAIFHRAFDCVKDPYQSMEILIDLGVKRVLTSGLNNTAMEGIELLTKLQDKYGDKIEILTGGGVNAENASVLMNKTGILQYHSSCKNWMRDKTTISNDVSFAFAEPPHQEEYNIVDPGIATDFVKAIKGAS